MTDSQKQQSVTRDDLARYLSEMHGFNKREARELVDSFFLNVQKALESEHDVRLPGLGRFFYRDKNQRPGMNPKTGSQVTIDARRIVVFKASQKIKSRIDRNLGVAS